MASVVKWGGIATGALAAVCMLALSVIYLTSEAVIVRRYTLPSSIVQAAAAPADRTRGMHVATIFGCRDCHGSDLSGRQMWVPPDLSIAAPDLRAFVAHYSDADFDRAVRNGLTPDARAIWAMPSESYVYMRNTDLAGILGYVRALPRDGHALLSSSPSFGVGARLAILEGTIASVPPYDLGQHPPVDAGPRYDGGRYLAAMACSGCHATDLTGSGAAPDLKIVGGYTRTQFFALLHGAKAPGGRKLHEMAWLAGTRFYDFKDYEIDALYAYLVARAKLADTDRAIRR